MTSPIDPIRRAANLRRARRASDAQRPEDSPESESANLPVPVGPARAVPPPEPIMATDAVFAAQMLGQDGQKRGLRAGPTAIDQARTSYNRAEWSGSKDRRARKGTQAKTEI
jgi:hypothetical protein